MQRGGGGIRSFPQKLVTICALIFVGITLFVLLSRASGSDFILSEYLTTKEVIEHNVASPAVRVTSSSAITRRNHGCVVRPVSEDPFFSFASEKERMFLSPATKFEAILFSGRWGSNIEVLDVSTGTYSLKSALKVPELDANHLSAEYVPSLTGDGDEIWIMCGFEGDIVNAEIAKTNIVIINTRTWDVEIGPALDIARGGCASTQFAGPRTGSWRYAPESFPTSAERNLKKKSFRAEKGAAKSDDDWIKGRMVCVIGGFVGEHDRGYSVDTVSCYDRVDRTWVSLPPLPNKLDHHNAVYIKGGTCPNFERDSLVVLNGRNGPYNMTIPEIHQLVLGDSQWTTWKEAAPSRTGASSVSLTKEGILISVGGIEYPTGHVEFAYRSDQIHLLDLCGKRSCTARSTLLHPKWALYPCHSPRDDFLLICGGASTFHDSNRNSPYCETINIPLLQQECHEKWTPAPSLESVWKKP